MISVSRWTPNGFVRTSSEVSLDRSVSITSIREASGGSVWFGGVGGLWRWERHSPSWSEFAECPPPKFVDYDNRIWFADTHRAAVYDSQKQAWIAPPVVVSASMAFLDAGPDGDILALPWGFLTQKTGLRYLYDSVWTEEGALVLCGTDKEGRVLEAMYYKRR